VWGWTERIATKRATASHFDPPKPPIYAQWMHSACRLSGHEAKRATASLWNDRMPRSNAFFCRGKCGDIFFFWEGPQ